MFTFVAGLIVAEGAIRLSVADLTSSQYDQIVGIVSFKTCRALAHVVVRQTTLF